VYVGLFDRETNPRFKVGYSSDGYKGRAAAHGSHKNGVIQVYEPLCSVKAEQAHEAFIHRAFKKHSFNGCDEIFHPVDEIAEWVRWLRDQYFTYVPDDKLCEPEEKMRVVDFDLWKPSSGRRKKVVPDGSLFDQQYALFFPPRVLTADDFYTHEKIIEAARETLGGTIDLAPASHPIANRVIRATDIFTAADNGLNAEWHGSVWLNPPFSKWEEFAPKVIEEVSNGRVHELCALSACRTITAQYFEAFHRTCDGLCVMHGRIPFWGGLAGNKPDDGHVIFYFGKNPNRFRDAFCHLGTVYLNTKAGAS